MANLVKNISMGIGAMQKDFKLATAAAAAVAAKLTTTTTTRTTTTTTRRIITITAKPPPPRKVMLDRLPPLPPKPVAAVPLVPRWMAYADKKRRVVFQRPPPPHPLIHMSNKGNIIVRTQVKSLGVVQAEPREYVARYGPSLKHTYELPQFVRDLRRDQFLISNKVYNPLVKIAQRDMYLNSKGAFAVTISKATPLSTISTPISRLIIN